MCAAAQGRGPGALPRYVSDTKRTPSPGASTTAQVPTPGIPAGASIPYLLKCVGTHVRPAALFAPANCWGPACLSAGHERPQSWVVHAASAANKGTAAEARWLKGRGSDVHGRVGRCSHSPACSVCPHLQKEARGGRGCPHVHRPEHNRKAECRAGDPPPSLVPALRPGPLRAPQPPEGPPRASSGKQAWLRSAALQSLSLCRGNAPESRLFRAARWGRRQPGGSLGLCVLKERKRDASKRIAGDKDEVPSETSSGL